MKELTKIIEEKDGIQTVNARELHEFLESKQDFSTWIKNRIEKYGFIENEDYTLHKFVERGNSGAQTKIDYHISIDMAKELSMVENNEKGRQARRYFIESEKKLKKVIAIKDDAKITTAYLEGLLYLIKAHDRKQSEFEIRLRTLEREVDNKPFNPLPIIKNKSNDSSIILFWKYFLKCYSEDLLENQVIPYGNELILSIPNILKIVKSSAKLDGYKINLNISDADVHLRSCHKAVRINKSLINDLFHLDITFGNAFYVYSVQNEYDEFIRKIEKDY